MYRKILVELNNWLKDGSKKPLMLIGARQTGKTYILNEFCKNNFSEYFYFNLEKDIEITRIFEDTLDPKKIIESIELIKNININPNDSIIFFDEIQVSERAITSLKYFCESDEEYKILCAGSLLGVKINRFKSSFPVGKVNIKYLYPMDFEEFLMALNENKLIEEIKKHFEKNEPIYEAVHNKALNLYKKYLCIGGMPSMINDFVAKNNELAHANFEIQDQIITSYLADMNKYTINSEGIKNSKIYHAIPRSLAKENSIFKFSSVEETARRSRYESSLDWLLASNMIIKCNLVNRNESPLKAYENQDKFKLYLNDVGLLRALTNISINEIMFDKNEMYKGVLTENYVVNELTRIYKEVYFYLFDKYEIDFLIKINGQIIPVEVKSSRNTISKSFKEYMKEYNPEYGIKISMKNFGFENRIKSIPLYALFCLNK